MRIHDQWTLNMICCYVYHWLSLYHSHTWKDVQIGIQTSGCDAGRSSSSNTSTYTYTCGDHSSLKLRAVRLGSFRRFALQEKVWRRSDLIAWLMNWFDLGIDGFLNWILLSLVFIKYIMHQVFLIDLHSCFFALFWLLCSVQCISIQLPP